MFEPDFSSTLVTAIGFNLFIILAITGFIICMFVYHKLFPDNDNEELKKENELLKQHYKALSQAQPVDTSTKKRINALNSQVHYYKQQVKKLQSKK